MGAMAAQTRRDGVLAVHSVHEFVYTVPDLGVARRFYEAFGLDVRQEGEALALYTHGHPHRWARVFQQGEAKRLQWISWGVYEEDLPAFAQMLASGRLSRIDSPELAGMDAAGLWFKGPDGMPQQIVAAEKCSPSAKASRDYPPLLSDHGRAPQRSQLTQVRPRHLSHILTFTASVDEGLDFYQRLLGLRLSDRSASAIAFMHTPHGSDHHLLALAHSDGYGLHHSSWDVASVDEVGIGIQQMAQAGYGQGWGLGRHVLGSNYFRYVRDPWGSYAEYSFDIDHVPNTLDWAPGNYPPEDSIYVWGPDMPEDFIVNYETSEHSGQA